MVPYTTTRRGQRTVALVRYGRERRSDGGRVSPP